MPFEFCTKHLKRWERNISVCLGCHNEAVNVERAAVVNKVVNKPADVNKRTVYMREYQRKRRAKVK